MEDLAAEHGSFANFFANWPTEDQVGLMLYFKKKGSRLGGQTGQYFIRFMQKDGFITSSDVIAALIANGVDISDNPTSQRDLRRIQDAFNQWHQETGMPYSHLSKVLAYTAGDNVDVEIIANYSNRQSLVD
jgi:3-methyladenine DNA glycosylase Tag